jgi:hypothetical protein
MEKLNYINKTLRAVSKEHLLKVLHDLNKKHEADRREMQRGVADALRSGFYCTGGRSDIKPLL